MTSQKKIEANRRNALKSTGPRTPEGKARSSQNARKHGLFAECVIAPGEDPSGFDAFVAGYFKKYSPADPEESDLVFQMASAQWRLRRAARLEAGLLTKGFPKKMPSAPGAANARKTAGLCARGLGEAFSNQIASFNTLSRIENSVRRSYYKSVERLGELHELRQEFPLPAQNKNYGTNPFSGPDPAPQLLEINDLAAPPPALRAAK